MKDLTDMSRDSTKAIERTLTRRQFASDNYAGICPEAWESLAAANAGHASAYGEDGYTKRAKERIQDWFETDCEVFFTFTGTGANALAMSAMCNSYHAVICHEYSHLATDECGAAEFFTGGAKLLPIGGNDGKLVPSEIETRFHARTDVHFSKPRAISITQATEVGTVYSPEEVVAISDVAKQNNLGLHMDGARFSNALASLNVSPADATWRSGVDILSLGGTKIGLPVGEALVFFHQRFSKDFIYRRKQSAQLCSKMRFLAAPWLGMLGPCGSGETPIVRHAKHANAMATTLRAGLDEIPSLSLPFPTQANAVFVDMPVELQNGLQERGWKFYALIGETICRLMCAWDTTEDDVQAFVSDIREVAAD